jgi:hypothetical protein
MGSLNRRRGISREGVSGLINTTYSTKPKLIHTLGYRDEAVPSQVSSQALCPKYHELESMVATMPGELQMIDVSPAASFVYGADLC